MWTSQDYLRPLNKIKHELHGKTFTQTWLETYPKHSLQFQRGAKLQPPQICPPCLGNPAVGSITTKYLVNRCFGYARAIVFDARYEMLGQGVQGLQCFFSYLSDYDDMDEHGAHATAPKTRDICIEIYLHFWKY